MCGRNHILALNWDTKLEPLKLKLGVRVFQMTIDVKRTTTKARFFKVVGRRTKLGEGNKTHLRVAPDNILIKDKLMMGPLSVPLMSAKLETFQPPPSETKEK